MQNTENKTKKFIALATYVAAVLCLLAGLFLPLFDGKNMLALQLPEALKCLLKKGNPDAEYAFSLTYPISLFGIEKLTFDFMALVVLLYAALTALALLAFIPVAFSVRKEGKVAKRLYYVVEVAEVIVLSVFFVVILQDYRPVYNMIIALGGTAAALVVLSALDKGKASAAKITMFLLSAIGFLALFDFVELLSKQDAYASVQEKIKLGAAFTGETSGAEYLTILFADNIKNAFASLAQPDAKSKALVVMLSITATALLVNFFITTLKLATGKDKKVGTIFDIARYGLSVAAAACSLITAAICKANIGLMLVAATAASAIQLAIVLIRFIVSAVKKPANERDALADGDVADEEPEHDAYNENAPLRVYDDGYNEEPYDDGYRSEDYDGGYTEEPYDDGYRPPEEDNVEIEEVYDDYNDYDGYDSPDEQASDSAEPAEEQAEETSSEPEPVEETAEGSEAESVENEQTYEQLDLEDIAILKPAADTTYLLPVDETPAEEPAKATEEPAEEPKEEPAEEQHKETEDDNELDQDLDEPAEQPMEHPYKFNDDSFERPSEGAREERYDSRVRRPYPEEIKPYNPYEKHGNPFKDFEQPAQPYNPYYNQQQGYNQQPQARPEYPQQQARPEYSQPQPRHDYAQPQARPEYSQPQPRHDYAQPQARPEYPQQQSYAQPQARHDYGQQPARAQYEQPARPAERPQGVRPLQPRTIIQEFNPVPPVSEQPMKEVYTIDAIYGGPTDDFIRKLSNEERIEFARTFIEKSRGYLGNIPDYVIGGDNKKFFSATFIYLGRIRGLVSDGLLNKMYKELNML